MTDSEQKNSATKTASGLKGAPRILVVDDEELMRDVVGMMIEENGGTFMTAVDGEMAVSTYSQNKDSIDFVLLDFSMPKKSGYEAFTEIKKLNPNVLVLFFSGLKVTPEVEQLRKSGEVEFLSKPFLEADLIKACNRLQQRLESRTR